MLGVDPCVRVADLESEGGFREQAGLDLDRARAALGPGLGAKETPGQEAAVLRAREELVPSDRGSRI